VARRGLSLTAAPLVRPWRPRLPARATGALVVPLAAALALLVAYPLVRLVIESFHGGTGAYRDVFSDAVRRRVLIATVWQSAVVTAACLLVGYMLAWMVFSTRSRPLRLAGWLAVLVPMWMSVVVKNYAWIIILGRRGVLAWAFDAVGLPRQDLLFTKTAVVLGMVYTLLPFAVLPLFLALNAIPKATIRAAESLGARPWTLQTTVVLPLVRPAILVTAGLVFVLTLGFYVTPVILGGPSSNFIAALVQDDIFQRFDQPSAAATSVILLLIAVVCVAATVRLVGRRAFEETIG
jgi:ABC-type spermidine/putrescine transport system permease subunit I